ncbi:MAG: hypothetical protein IJH41_04675 [Eubacterium sp.]|nr:hypothetical protein [Eubacterium sp.]MBQ3412002.1 hypothetical protein [Oscillospiraceae bacterium]
MRHRKKHKMPLMTAAELVEMIRRADETAVFRVSVTGGENERREGRTVPPEGSGSETVREGE